MKRKFEVHYSPGFYPTEKQGMIHIHANTSTEASECVLTDGVGYRDGHKVIPNKVIEVKDVTPESWNR